MRKRLLIFAGGALVAAFFLGWWFQESGTPVSKQLPATTDYAVESTPARQTSESSTGEAPSGGSHPVANSVPQSEATPEKQRQTVQEIFAEQNERPLDFYGLVTDQRGEPVSGAEVEGSVLLNLSFVASSGQVYRVETDTQGRFNFLGLHGVKLGIRPKKDGYFYDPKLPSSRPEDYIPDPGNPITFVMWRLKGAEPLEHTEFESRIPYDGTSVCFDLRTGKKLANTDEGLRVALLRSPLQIAPGLMRPYDWSATIEIAGGGIIEASDAYPYWAPDAGYQRLYETGMRSNAVPWQAELRRSFYIKNSQGHYGLMRIELSTSSKRPDTGIKVEAWLNPSGSQNLELDPAAQAQ